MDADVMITAAFCLEVFLFGLASGVFVAHEARKARPEAATDTRPRPSAIANVRAADPEPLVTARAVRGGRS
jgi:hypothetical protein